MNNELFDCIKNVILKSEQTIIPGFLIETEIIEGDGACQFRSIANQINNFNGTKDSLKIQEIMARKMYLVVKNIVVNILPKLTNQQLVEIFKFEEIDFDLSPIENLNMYIFNAHSGIIDNLEEYSRKFKYGVFTSNFELRILLSDYLSNFWQSEYGIPVPCVIIYLYSHDKNNYIEIDCKNRLRAEFITFRILYVDSIHYESMYLTSDLFNEVIIKNSCRI